MATVAKYMVRPRKPPSPTWRSFLNTHVGHIATVDFFTVATITFRVLYCFIVLRHDRRQLIHVNVTANPTAQWAARQVHQAFPYDTAPRYVIRDRDSIYGETFRQSIEQMDIEEALIAPRSPWQNPYAERVIGPIGRECLDHAFSLRSRSAAVDTPYGLTGHLSRNTRCRQEMSCESWSRDVRCCPCSPS